MLESWYKILSLNKFGFEFVTSNPRKKNSILIYCDKCQNASQVQGFQRKNDMTSWNHFSQRKCYYTWYMLTASGTT